MSQEKDKSRRSNDILEWQTHSETKAGSELDFAHTLSGIRTEAFKQMHLPLGNGLYGLVMETHKGYIIDDYLKNKDIKHLADGIIADDGVISGMAVPVQIRDRNLGVLYVFNRRKLFSQRKIWIPLHCSATWLRWR